ncbi:MAG: cell division protein SepF [Ruminococcaceae bacterium]|nr:cell division protein SepF [Oscillospiraceae bacterium]
MSFWDNMKKFTQPYADDDYDEFEEDEVAEGFEEVPAERPARPSRRSSLFGGSAAAEETPSYTAASGSNVSGFSGHVVSMNNKQEVILFRPTNFNDTSTAADHLRNKKAVIVNMENVDKAMSRRVVDFLSGCAYALDGKVKKVAQATYLFCPHNMDVVGDLENIQSEAETYL